MNRSINIYGIKKINNKNSIRKGSAVIIDKLRYFIRIRRRGILIYIRKIVRGKGIVKRKSYCLMELSRFRSQKKFRFMCLIICSL
jgi:hypothetical protein